MPIVSSDIPYLLTAGLKATFFQALEEMGANSLWQRISTIVPSGMESESYAWLGSLPAMREFTDERLIKALSEYHYSITNKTWEASIGVHRAALEDDQYGQINVRVRGLAEETSRHKDQLVFELLAAGFSTACYDTSGTGYFFQASHSEGDSGTQSNLGSSALSATTLQAAITAMSKFKGDTGKPLGIIPDTLVIPPDLKWTAMELLTSQYNVDESAAAAVNMKRNILQGEGIQLVMSPYLTDTDNWYLLCTKRAVRPIIMQDRIPTEFTGLEGTSDNGFMRDQWVYGVRARYNVGYGLWQCAYGASV